MITWTDSRVVIGVLTRLWVVKPSKPRVANRRFQW
jgi:hypothetical protein